MWLSGPNSEITDAESLDEGVPEIDHPSQRRRPAIPVALCLAAGIVLDRWLGLAWSVWFASSLFLLLCWWGFRRLPLQRRTATFLLGACVCLGGARHHQVWSVRCADDVSRFASTQPRPVRLAGRIATQPEIRPRQKETRLSAWPRYDSSTCLLECRWLQSNDGWIPVSGLARLSVSGHLLHVAVGDEVDVRGLFYRPRPPENPGEFDFGQYVRLLGTDCVIHADYPDAVGRMAGGETGGLRRWAGCFRNMGEFLLAKHLSPEALPTASALLLGSRTRLNDEVRRIFAESGMMHLLTISGLHVGILASFVWLCCCTLNLSTRSTSAVVLACVVAYAFLTGGRPPVVRATIFLLIAFCGRPWHRQPVFDNTLGVAAVVILIWNPVDLFDVGAQLSFLAVAGIIWSGSLKPRQNRVASPLERVALKHESRWRRRSREMLALLRKGYVLMFGIWLFTVPLVASRFNLISPIGFVINVVLMPLVVLVLWTGYGFLFCAFLIPGLAAVCGLAFDEGLRLLLGVVEAASLLRIGHLYVPAPAEWWLVGYYLLLASAVCLRSVRPIRSGIWIGLSTWVVVGLAIALVPPQRNGLRLTFLSVGHGCSVLVELPGGKTLLYDAGSLSDEDWTERIVEGVLWKRGVTHLDAVIVSHADIDHFNAVPGLFCRMPVGSLLVSETFLDFEQESVVELCRAASGRGVPIQLIGRGERLKLDERATISVLHPAGAGSASDDNVNSVVLQIDYAGRRILLPGDLEENGVDQLLAQPARTIDVLLAPHHGAGLDNSSQLAAWARPSWVVVSGGRWVRLPRLRKAYAKGTRLLATNEQGAITFAIDPAGTIRASSFLNGPISTAD